MAAARRAVILGVDGADFSYYRRWMEAGLAPCLARLAGRGRMGVLRSTYPPVTVPAWVSLTTGEHPGSHGLFGFFQPASGDGRYTRAVADTTAIEAPFLWEVVSGSGGRCAVVNVPVTYPIRPLDGVLVAGMLTPEGADMAYPPEYLERLRREAPDYRIDLHWQDYRGRTADLVRDQKEVTRKRAELCVRLMKEEPWDFFMAVFTGTDRLQHCLHPEVMRIHDEEAVRADALTAAVRDYFVSLDAWLGEIMEAAGEDAAIFVVSDHGFGPMRRSCYFNRWLAEEGLLKVKSPASARARSRWKRVLNSLGIRRSTLRKLGRAVGLERLADVQAERMNPHVGGIDWGRTTVYYMPVGGFLVNLRGREMFGTVEPGAEYEAVRDDLIRRLEKLEDPETGKRILAEVRRREDVYGGRNADRLPDVVVEFGDEPYEAFLKDYDVDGFLQPNDHMNGTHRRGGLYIGAGPGLARGPEVEGLDIFDVAPNVLHAMGQPIPEHMDGRFREDLFTREGAEGVRYEAFDRRTAKFGALTEEQRADLERQLKGLGYL